MSVHSAAGFVYPCFATTPLRRGQQAQVDAHRRVLCARVPCCLCDMSYGTHTYDRWLCDVAFSMCMRGLPENLCCCCMPCRTDTCAHSTNVAAAPLQPDVHRSVPGSGMRGLVRVHGIVHSTSSGALFSAQLRQLCCGSGGRLGGTADNAAVCEV